MGKQKVKVGKIPKSSDVLVRYLHMATWRRRKGRKTKSSYQAKGARDKK